MRSPYRKRLNPNTIRFRRQRSEAFRDGEHHQFPSFIIATLNFNNGIINTGDFEHYIFVRNEMYKVSESRYDLSRGKNLQLKEIKNIEIKEPLKKNDIREILIKNNIKIENNEKTLRLNAVEKFNKKWNR